MARARAGTVQVDPTIRLVLRALGVSERGVLERAELPIDTIMRAPIRLGTPEFFRLWAALEAEVDRRTFVFELLEAYRPDGFHPLLFATLSSSNFTIATGRLSHYKRLVGPMLLDVHDQPETLTLELRWARDVPAPPPSLELFELLFYLRLGRIGTRVDLLATKLEFANPIADEASTQAYAGCAVTPSTRNALTVSREDARRPFVSENAAMWTALEPRLDVRLDQLDHGSSTEARVRSVLLQTLPAGESSMDCVAGRLGTSKRTLQRRLRSEQTTFQTVLGNTRAALARHYLLETRLSGAEISYLLGFEDPNSFFRAFHGWTGQTAEQFRNRPTDA